MWVFQWFLTSLSVLCGRYEAMAAHLHTNMAHSIMQRICVQVKSNYSVHEEQFTCCLAMTGGGWSILLLVEWSCHAWFLVWGSLSILICSSCCISSSLEVEDDNNFMQSKQGKQEKHRNPTTHGRKLRRTHFTSISRYRSPLSRTMFLDVGDQYDIFFWSPRAFLDASLCTKQRPAHHDSLLQVFSSAFFLHPLPVSHQHVGVYVRRHVETQLSFTCHPSLSSHLLPRLVMSHDSANPTAKEKLWLSWSLSVSRSLGHLMLVK